MVNRIIDAARRRQRTEVGDFDEWATQHIPSPQRGPEECAASEEACRQIREAVAALPEDLRQTLVATVLDGYSYQEAAELLNVAPGTIGSRLTKARAILQAQIPQSFR